MSLLNRVLRDLSRRPAATREPLAGVLLRGRPGGRHRVRRAVLFAGLVALMTVGLVTGRLAWDRLHRGASSGSAAVASTDATGSAASGGAEQGGDGARGAAPAARTERTRLLAVDSPASGGYWLELQFDRPVSYGVSPAGDVWRVRIPGAEPRGDIPVLPRDPRVADARLAAVAGGMVLEVRPVPGVTVEDRAVPATDTRPGRVRLALVGEPRTAEAPAGDGEPATPTGRAKRSPESGRAAATGDEAAGTRDVAAETGADHPADADRDRREPAMSRRERRPSVEERAERLYRDARAALENGRRASAESALRRALSLNPAHRASREALAAVLVNAGRMEAAREVIDAAPNPDRPVYRRLRARAVAATEGPEAALAILEAVPPRLTANPEYHALMAALYQRAGRYEKGVETYRALLERWPRQATWWVGAAICLERLGRTEDAVEAYRRAVASGGLDGRLLEYARRRIDALQG